MAWVCPNCGTKNEGGLFNFCKKCGSTPPRGPTAHGGEPTAREAKPAPQPRRPEPRVVTSSTRSGRGGGGRKGMGVFSVVVAIVIVAAGLVIGIAGQVDVGDAIRELTEAETAPQQEFSQPEISLPDVLSELGITDVDGTTTPTETASTETEPPATTGPPVEPALDIARQRDVRCANRWNGTQNARARQAIVAAAQGARLFAGVQLASAQTSGGGGVGPVLDGVCVVIVGTQPDVTTPTLRPGDVYAEAGPVSGPRRPFVRLPTVSLSYQWNARVAKNGRIAPKRAN